MKRISVSLTRELMDKINNDRGHLPLSTYVTHKIREALKHETA